MEDNFFSLSSLALCVYPDNVGETKAEIKVGSFFLSLSCFAWAARAALGGPAGLPLWACLFEPVSSS